MKTQMQITHSSGVSFAANETIDLTPYIKFRILRVISADSSKSSLVSYTFVEGYLEYDHLTESVGNEE